MTPDFSFPPPPPPPPKASSQEFRGYHHQGSFRGQARGGRARGRGGNSRGGPNGEYRGRGDYHATHSRSNFQSHGSNVGNGAKGAAAQSFYADAGPSQSSDARNINNGTNYSELATHPWLANGQMHPSQSFGPTGYQPYMNGWGLQPKTLMQQQQQTTSGSAQASNNGKRKQEGAGHAPRKFSKTADTGDHETAPPVPQFGVPLPQTNPAPTSRKDSGTGSVKTHKRAERMLRQKRKHNELGLTPSGLDQESEAEDDADEEVRLGSLTQTGPLRITHRGRVHVIRNAEEMATWIEERKKHFPTKVKADEKLKEIRARTQRDQKEEARKKALESQTQKSKAKDELGPRPSETRNQPQSEKHNGKPKTRTIGARRAPKDFSTEIERLQKQLDICNSKASQYQSAAQNYRHAIASLKSVSQTIAQADKELTAPDDTHDDTHDESQKVSSSTVEGHTNIENAGRPIKSIVNLTPESENLLVDSPSITSSSSSGPESGGTSSESDSYSDTPSEHGTRVIREDDALLEIDLNQPPVKDSNEVASGEPRTSAHTIDSAPASLGQSTQHVSPHGRPNDNRELCAHFARMGYCKFGDLCRGRHDKSQLTRTAQRQNWKERDRTSNGHQDKSENSREAKRPRLRQLMQEREIKAENQLVLDSIKWMGDKGVFVS
ncbi:MAG: hypothetical protein M1831_000625 [Alyxoria varia]|nr:MAG: hypothetical protein M1831_000625 [Alyxoria varia]